MSMDLSTLKFQVDTTELVDAQLQIGKVAEAVDKLAKPIGELNQQSKKLGKSAGDAGKALGEGLAKPADEAGESLSRVEKMIQKAGLSLAILRNQTIETSDGTYKVVDSFTKMQAGMLASAKQAGATTAQLTDLSQIIKQTNDIMGKNPFDASASGLAKMRQEVQELTSITALQAQGLALTGKELQEYSRDVTRVTAAFRAEGKAAAELQDALGRLKSETLDYSAQKAKLLAQSKEAEAQVKREATAALELERAEQQSVETTRRNFNYRIQFIEEQQRAEREASNAVLAQMRQQYLADEKATKDVEDLMERQAAARQRATIQQGFMAQGFSTGLSGKAATMQQQGVDPAVIKSYLDEAHAIEQATKAARAQAAAVQYLTDVEARLDAQLKPGNNLRKEYTDELVKLKAATVASGVGAEQAGKKFDVLNDKVQQVASKERQKELDRLARGVSVQMGDVGISLASGMNPLLVMIQQGDQLRGLFQDVKASSGELKKTMSSAFTQIGTSILETSKAVGLFFVGSIMDAGKSFGNFSKQIPILGFASQQLAIQTAKVNEKAAQGSAAWAGFAKVLSYFGTVMTFIAAIPVITAITAVIATIVAFVQAVKEVDSFTRSMTLAGGALDLTSSQASKMSQSLQGAGISTSDTMKVMTEMGKTGELTSKSVEMVTKAAIGLKTYGGVAIADTVKVFADLAKDPLDALFKVAKQTGLVTYESLRLVESLKMQGDEQGAATAAMKIYAEVTNQQIKNLKENYTDFGLFVIDFGKGIVNVFSKIKNALSDLFIKPAEVEQFARLSEEIVNIQTLLNSGTTVGSYTTDLEQRKKERTDELAGLVAKFKLQDDLRVQQEKDIDLQKEAAKLREKNLSLQDKYIAAVKKAANQKMTVREEDKPAFDSEIARLAKEYGEAVEKVTKKENKLSDAQKEANRLRGVGENMLKRITEQTNGSTAAVEHLNKAQKLQLDIYSNPEFATQEVQMKKDIAALLNKAVATNTAADAETANGKAMSVAEGLMGKLDDKGKDYYATQKILTDALASSTNQYGEYTDVLLQALDALEKTTPAAKASAKAIKDLGDFVAKTSVEYNTLLEAYALEEQFLFSGTAAREKKIKALKIEAEYTTEMLKLNKEFAKTDGGKEAVDAYVAAVLAAVKNKELKIDLIDKDATLKTLQEVVDNVQKGLSDVIFTAITGKGKDAAAKLRELLEQEFLKKPLRMIIEAVVRKSSEDFANKSMKSFAKNFFGSTSDKGSIIGILKDGFKTFKDAFSAGQSSATPFADAGEFFQSGDYLKSAGSVAGAVSSYLGAYTAGKSVGTLIGDGYSTGGSSGNGAINAGAVIGTIFGAGSPIGTAIGAAIGGVINKVFGKKLVGSRIDGQFSSQGFSGQQIDSYKGGLFRSDSQKSYDLSRETTSELSKAYAAILADVKAFGSAFGKDFSAEAADSFKSSLSIDLKGLSQEDALKKFSEAIVKVSNDLVSGSIKLKNYTKEGESSAEALKRLFTGLTEVNRIFKLMNKTLYESSIVGADMADQLISSFSSVGDFNSAMQSFFENFYSEEEVLRLKTKALTAEFATLGFSLPKTRDEFLKLAESQNLNSKAGRDTYAALIKLSSAFAEVTPRLDTLAGKFGTLIGTMFDGAIAQIDAQISASKTAATEARRVAEEYFSVADSLRAYAQSISGSSAASNYGSVLSAAQSGDVGAMQKLEGAAGDFIENIRSNSSSTEEFNRKVAQVQQELLQVAALAGVQGTAAELQAQLLDINTQLLEELKASIETQNVTVDLLTEQLAALDLVGQLITSSSNLSIAQGITNTGQIRTGLVDNAGNVVASIDSTTAAQLVALAANKASIDATASNVITSASGQTVAFGSIIGGQTTAYTGLSQDQIAALGNVEEVGAQNADYAASVALLTNSNNAILDAVLNSLDSSTLSFTNLISTVSTGNDSLRTVLNNILTQLQVDANVPGVSQGFVGPVQTSTQYQLTAAQNLLAQIRDSALPIIAAAEAQRDRIAEELQIAEAGDDPGQVLLLIRQLAIYNGRINNLTTSRDNDLEAQRQIIRNLGGIPAFATGGMHSGGMRLVGENGPELEVTGPSRIFNASQTAGMFGSGDTSELLQTLIDKVEMLEAAARSSAVSNNKVAKILDRVSPDGNSLQIVTAV